jgi:hypothetical protein
MADQGRKNIIEETMNELSKSCEPTPAGALVRFEPVFARRDCTLHWAKTWASAAK